MYSATVAAAVWKVGPRVQQLLIEWLQIISENLKIKGAPTETEKPEITGQLLAANPTEAQQISNIIKTLKLPARN